MNFHRILIVRTDRIGDVLLTLPMAKALKQCLPSLHVGMLIQRYTADIVEDDKFVDQILFCDEGNRTVSFFRLLTTLQAERFDVVFHSYPRFHLALITWLARIPVRVGTGYRWYSFFFNRKVYEHRKDAKRHELEYNLNLLKAIDCPVSYDGIAPSIDVKPETLERVRIMLTKQGIQKDERIIILHPGSGASARDWSSENFGTLGKTLAELSKIRIIVTGGTAEQDIVHSVKSAVGEKALSMADTMNLKEFAALAKIASLFVSNSTGPIHIAAAVGTPVIGLYSHIKALSAERWGPYTSNKVIFSPVGKPQDCTLCVEGKKPCECMSSISVDEVSRAARQYLMN